MFKPNIILTIVLQSAITLIVTFCIYMFFAFLDNDFGFDGLFGLIFFQPIIAVVVSGLTIILCLIVGLPIRLNNKLNYWWISNFYIPILGTIIGLSLMLLAILPLFLETVTATIDGQETLKQIPNLTLILVGWFLTAFSFLHIFPPHWLNKQIKNLFQKD